jgi:hypothetical protein
VIGEAFSAPAAGGQSYVERPPVPALRELASSVWVQQVGRDAAPYAHRRIPNGAVELVCRVGSVPQVIGPLTESLVEVLEPGTTVVGMRFVPGAFPAVAGQPASEVVGLALDAEELWGSSAAALGETVGTAASPRRRSPPCSSTCTSAPAPASPRTRSCPRRCGVSCRGAPAT